MVDPLLRRGLVNHVADAGAQDLVDRAHLLGVAADQVVVDRDHVDRPPAPGPHAGGHGRSQGLALAGRHFRDVPVDHGQGAHDLDGEGPQPDRAPRPFAGDGHRLVLDRTGQAVDPGEVAGLGDGFLELGRAEGVDVLFEYFDALGLGPVSLEGGRVVLEPPGDAVGRRVQPAQLRRLDAAGVEDGPQFVGGDLGHG